ncbi:MAG: autotransporter domain-containing protein [Chlamydiales bacterium]|nr:autotransporter domain-containing protein [Chlamydiales bacterium]
MRFALIFLAIIVLNIKLFAGSASWIQDGGNWSEPSTWDPHTVPNSSSDVATFTDAAGTFAGGNVDSTFSIASLNFTTALFFTLNNGTLNTYDSITVNEATGGASCNTTLSLQNDISIITDAQFACQSITGTGGIIKTGSDILSTSNICTYSGTTFVNEGIFRAGFDDAFSHNSAIVLANVAGVELNNPGLSNTILNLSGGGSLGGNVTFDNGDVGSLTLGDSNDTTYAGVISGRGEIIKKGSGTFTLTGINTYTEGTTAQAGQLVVNGSITGGITINSGATLKGTGTISAGGTINGTLSPGNSIGIITFNTADADLTLSNSSVTQIELNSSRSSKIINVGGGNIALGGGVSLIQNDDGNYARNGQYTILSGAYTGEFASSVSGALPGFLFNLAYGSDIVYLLYEVQSISTNGLSGNDLTFANYLNNYAPVSSEYLALVTLPTSQQSNAINIVSPARNAFGPFVTQQTVFSLSQLVSGHLDNKRFSAFHTSSKTTPIALGNQHQNLYSNSCLPCTTVKKRDNAFDLWFSSFVDFAHQSKESENPSFNFMSEALLLGLDYNLLDTLQVGGCLGFAHSQIHDNDHYGKANIPYYFGAIYGSFILDKFYIEPAFWAVFHQIHNERYISYDGIDVTASGTMNGWQIDPHLGLGYDIDMSWGNIEPFAAFDWVVNWEGSLQEHGASNLDMYQKSHTLSMLQSEVGVTFYQSFDKSFGQLCFKEGGSYINRAPFGTGKVTTAIFGSPQFVTLQSFTKVQNLGALNLEFLANIGKKRDISISLGYEGQFGLDYISNEILLRIAKQF